MAAAKKKNINWARVRLVFFSGNLIFNTILSLLFTIEHMHEWEVIEGCVQLCFAIFTNWGIVLLAESWINSYKKVPKIREVVDYITHTAGVFTFVVCWGLLDFIYPLSWGQGLYRIMEYLVNVPNYTIYATASLGGLVYISLRKITT